MRFDSQVRGLGSRCNRQAATFAWAMYVYAYAYAYGEEKAGQGHGHAYGAPSKLGADYGSEGSCI